jgi:hypothetical protein
MIVRDLLPLYIEDLVSDETRAFVEEHLAECEDCRKALKRSQTRTELTRDSGALPLKRVKKQIKQQKLKSVFLAVVLVMAVLISGFAWLTAPQYVPYSEDLLTVTEESDGTIVISFDEAQTTGYKLSDFVLNEDGKEAILYIHAWKTPWDALFSERTLQDVILRRGAVQTIGVGGEVDIPIGQIYYSPNTREEAIRIYGDDPGYSTVELPRLVLRYYLMLAGLALLASGLLLLIFRKHPKTKTWIEKLSMLPGAYLISHVTTKGFATITYSSGRDFIFILLVTILLYTAGLLGLSLYRSNRELNTPLDA